MSYISWSIHYEDILLLRALQGVHHEQAFYIDVGANNPQEDSVTKLFYDHGWHGLNIEASPYWYSRLVAERPRDINIHAAASDRAGRETLYDHPEGGLATLNEEFADRHVEDWNIPKRAVEVEAVTLTSLCEQHAPKDIHFLKIDVEGHEEQVIRGMDFSRFRPWILCIEATEPMRVHVHTHDAWEPILLAADYQYTQFDGLNRWYVAKEHPERVNAMQFRVDDFVHWTRLRRITDLEAQVAALQQQLAAGKVPAL